MPVSFRSCTRFIPVSTVAHSRPFFLCHPARLPGASIWLGRLSCLCPVSRMSYFNSSAVFGPELIASQLHVSDSQVDTRWEGSVPTYFRLCILRQYAHFLAKSLQLFGVNTSLQYRLFCCPSFPSQCQFVNLKFVYHPRLSLTFDHGVNGLLIVIRNWM